MLDLRRASAAPRPSPGRPARARSRARPRTRAPPPACPRSRAGPTRGRGLVDARTVAVVLHPSRTAVADAVTATRAVHPGACRTTLSRASWATRNAARSTSLGGRPPQGVGCAHLDLDAHVRALLDALGEPLDAGQQAHLLEHDRPPRDEQRLHLVHRGRRSAARRSTVPPASASARARRSDGSTSACRSAASRPRSSSAASARPASRPGTSSSTNDPHDRQRVTGPAAHADRRPPRPPSTQRARVRVSAGRRSRTSPIASNAPIDAEPRPLRHALRARRRASARGSCPPAASPARSPGAQATATTARGRRPSCVA